MAIDPNVINQLTSLLRISAPGFNRPIGMGDVVPYLQTGRGPGAVGDTFSGQDVTAATPGPSGSFGPPPAPAAASAPGSLLNNLSALTPLINQLVASSQPVVSGQGNAQAQPAAQAVAGPSSADIGAMAPAGAPAAPAGPPAAPAGYIQISPTLALSSNGTGQVVSLIDGQWVGGNTGSALNGGEATGGAAAGAAGASGSDGGVAGTGAGSGPGAAGDAGGGVGASLARGGLVTAGNPKSKTDDVAAKLQHGEFVIPRMAVDHLARTAPHVLSHVMQVSALHRPPVAPAAGSPASRITGPAHMAQMAPADAVQGRPASIPPLARLEAGRAAAAKGGGGMGTPPPGV